MHKKAHAISVLFKGTPTRVWVALFLFASILGALTPLLMPKTEAATSSTINFQARLLQANGGIVPDGYYNIQFKLYDDSSSGSLLWTETRYDSNGATAGNDNRVRVANGYVTVNLGSVTAFPSINWDQELWLTMNIGGTSQTASPTWDGEMNPRLKFTASPYAFASGRLQTSSGANSSTLGFASQTASRNLLLPDESGTLCVQSSSGCGFAAASGSGSYIQNGTSPQSADFNISGSGIIGGALSTLKGTDYSTTGSQDNVNFGNVSLVRLTGASAQTITGIAGGTDGRRLTIINAGNTSATLLNNYVFSSSANRILTGIFDDLIIPSSSSVELIYDAGASKWRVVGSAAFSSGDFILNNAFTPQDADFNISGTGTIEGGLNLPGIDGADSGILFGGDTTLYSPGSAILKTDGVFEAGSRITANDGTANEVTLGMLAIGTAGAGMTFGSSQDTNLYRSAPNTLKTDDALVVAGVLNVTSTSNSYIMGALGLGTASPQTGSALTITNGTWVSAIDGAGTGYVNLFQVNSNNEIQVGAAMNIDGGIILPTNGGQLTLADMPLDSSSSAGTVHGYSLRVGTTNALTVYGQSDGAGGAQNVRVAIGSGITPGYVLDVTGDINSTTALRVAGTSVCTSSGCTPAAGSANYIQNGTGQQTSSNFNISGAGVVGTTLAVNGNTLSTTSTTMNLFNTGATTLNVGGAATTLSIGAASGTASFNGRVNIGGSVSARLAVTATNNNEPALYVRTTNTTGYGNALQVTNGTSNYMTIGAYGAVTFNLATGSNVPQAYRFNTGSDGLGILLDMNAQQQSVGIAKAASSTYTLDVNGSTNASSYYVNGTAISSSNLSDFSSIARKNTTNTLTSTSAFIITNGTTNGIIVDTQNDRVGIGTAGAPGNYTLDVGGKFMVDKPNNRLIVGTWGGDTSGTLMVLGNKTNAGDPTGVAGAMYYNSNLGAFRCYGSAGWQSCGPQTKRLGGDVSNATTTYGDVSGLSFAVLANTDYTLSCTLMYSSASTTAGLAISLNGPTSPTAISGIVNAYSGVSVNTSAGYGFRLYDGGAGIPDTSNNTSSYPATMDATFRNGATAGNLTVRLKSLTASQAATLREGSSCQLTPL